MKLEKILTVLVLAGVFFSACSPQSAAPAATAPAPAAAAQGTPASGALTPSGPASCKAVSVFATPVPGQSPFPDVTAQDWKLGPDTASVTFMEYSDFQ